MTAYTKWCIMESEEEEFKLKKQGEALVLNSGKGRQIILNDYGDEIGLWVRFLKVEIRVPKLEFIAHLFKD